MSKKLLRDEPERKHVGKLSVIFVSALFILGGFSVLTLMNAGAHAPTWSPPIVVTPSQIGLGQSFDATTDFTHAEAPGDTVDLTSGRIYIIDPAASPCTGTFDAASVDQNLLTFTTYVTNYRPDLPPFSLGPGFYAVYFWLANETGAGTCSGAHELEIQALDSSPPLVANHGLDPPVGSNPRFNTDPATTTTVLQVGISDVLTGNSLITDGEYWVRGPSPTPLPPDPAWVNDTGTKLTLSPFNPYYSPPEASSWNARQMVFTTTEVDVTGWSPGMYWFYIHGADCGEDQICMGGQGDDNWGKNAGLGNSFWVVNLTVGISNNAPVLNWTGQPGYVTDGVDPDSGPEGGFFTYKVKYSDADNDPPPGMGSIQAYVEKPCGSPIAGSPFLMGFEAWVGAPSDFVAGAIFNMTTILTPGSNLYAYYFSATDGTDPATGEPTIPCTSGPIVTSSNTPPVLSWTGEPNFVSDGIDPDNGNTVTVFEYRINYTDADDDPPLAGYPKLNVHKPCGVPWGGSPYTMTAVDAGDTTYTDGKLYQYFLTLTDAGTDYGYFFNATDGGDWATGAPTVPCTAGPDVTPFTNTAPVLDWTGQPGFVSDGVDPDTGDTSTIFAYRIKYSDIDNDPPAAGFPRVYIEKPCGVALVGSPFSMSFLEWVGSADDYGAGAIYIYQKTLPSAGTDYGYYFGASDGTDFATGPPTVPCTSGPIVTGSGAPAAPPNLWVEKSDPHIVVHWDTVSGATSYNVYRSTDRFAAFATWTQVTGVLTNSWQHDNAHNDLNTWYYIVRSYSSTGGESTNSTMGVKLHKDMGTPFTATRSIYWISLPYDSMYTKASDIVMDIEGSLSVPPTYINAVGKWNPDKQNSQIYMFRGNRWKGTDFAIAPGEGIFVNSINSNWDWIIVGTDASVLLGFSFNVGKNNINWISMPYTTSYQTASDIVMDIEGSLVTAPTKITEVAIWVAATQTVTTYYWDGAAWTGTDFTVDPGEGYYLDILSTFTWQPDLITPTVP